MSGARFSFKGFFGQLFRPEVDTAQLNAILDDIYTHDHQDIVSISEVSSGFVGVPPDPAIGNYVIKSGVNSVTTNGSGNATITYTDAFANGVLSVVVNQANMTTAADLGLVASSSDKTKFVVKSSLNNTSISVSWIAIGF